MNEVYVLESGDEDMCCAQSFCVVNQPDVDDIVDLKLQVLPTPAVIFLINEKAVLKLEPNNFTLGDDKVADTNSAYERFLAWLVKAESFNKQATE